MLKPDRFRSSQQIAISQTTPVQRVGIGIRESLRDLAREPRGVLLLVTLGVALLSRTLVTLLDLPTLFSFGFFPVLLGLALSVRARESVTGIPFMRLFALFTLVVASSAVASGTPFVAAVVLWASVSVPFLLLSSIPRSWASRSSREIRATYVGLLLVQGFLVLGEAVLLGKRSDAAQGFLSGQGAGHHVVGFIGAGTALYVGVHLAESVRARRTAVLWIAVVVGLSMAAISGTSQALLAWAILVLTYAVLRWRPLKLAQVLLIAVLVFAVAMSLWESMAPQGLSWYGEEYIKAKSATIEAISDEFQVHPELVPFGIGPGTTASRVAWLGEGSNLVAALGIEPGAIASELLRVERLKPVWRDSSLTAPWSTLLGIVGDLGLVGLAAYLSLWFYLGARFRHTPSGRAASVLIGYLLLIGLFYNWLEEPILTLFLSLPLADALIAEERARLKLGDNLPGSQPLGKTIGSNLTQARFDVE